MADGKKQMGTKLIFGILSFFAPVLILQILILILLQRNIISLTVALVLILVGVGCVFFVAARALYSLVVPLKLAVSGDTKELEKDSKIARRMEKIAARNDEFGEAVKNMQKTFFGLTETVAAIRKATLELEQVSEEFQEIFDSVEEVSVNTDAAVEEIIGNTRIQADKVSNIKEITDSISNAIEHIYQNVDSLKNSTETVLQYNADAMDNMKELIEISRVSGEAMEEVSRQTERTNASAQEIRKVTDIIAGISNQTNLLALNASIEAARAGEHGRGFSVVAEQIRELADQSKLSTEQINTIVNDLIGNANISVERAGKVSEAFDKQNEKIQNTENIFNSLNQELNQVGEVILDVSGKVSELEGYKDVIAESVEDLNRFSSDNVNDGMIAQKNMTELKKEMDLCRESTGRVGKVSSDLIDNIKNLESETTGRIPERNK